MTIIGAMWNRNLTILLASQFIAVSGSVLIVTIGGLIGAELSANPALATLPLSIMVLGTAAATVFAAMLMRRVGRRVGFAIGAGIATGAGLVSAYGLHNGSFAIFCLGVGLYGVNNAFVQQYRFAAAESVAASAASRAISLVLVGAIGGAFFGPLLATVGRDWAAQTYLGSMVAIAILQAIAIVFLLCLREPVVAADPSGQTPERRLGTIVAQPAFIVAVLSSVVGYGIMNLIMTATPLSMHVHDSLSLADTAWVIQSHVLAMYVPSFFSGVLIARLGVTRVIGAGLLAMLIAVVAGLSGHEVMHYWWSLVLVGVGWNFLFVGGTALLVDSYRPAERFKAQAVNEFSVFGASAAASLLAGTLIHLWGWDMVLWSTAPLLIGMLAVLFPFARRADTPRPQKA